jgi:hypothetical protein
MIISASKTGRSKIRQEFRIIIAKTYQIFPFHPFMIVTF